MANRDEASIGQSTIGPESSGILEEELSAGPAIAIIGMAGRFPGAQDVAQFWRNLVDGVDSVSHFTADQLEVAKATAAEPGYIGARSVLKDVDRFDAEFFGIYPREAELMDPQHRIFLECAWEALESAGHSPERYPGLIGVYAGCSMNTYFMHNLARDRAFLASFAEGYQSGSYTTMLGNDKDFLPTRVSYKLNLRGPSLSIQTACSTSLVAIAQACQGLLTYGCDMALAGAVSVTFPQQRGYLPEEGGILSTDGTIRPFDRNARGTVFGHGAGVVVLKRLDDAVADGDTVLAVIRGFAVNNDGSSKAGYTAPSASGQADVIAAAQAMAGFEPDTISYIEAHGTGTPLGDPVEVSGLTRAFSAGTGRRQFCVLGTAKANVGHLDVASGVVGLIKTVLQMQHRQIPRLLHFEQPNPEIDFAATPFHIPLETTAWSTPGRKLRAGVSAFGVGGTNAHVVLEEAPLLKAQSGISGAGTQASDARPRAPLDSTTPEVLVLSAKSQSALAAMAANLAGHLEMHPEIALADAAHTLQDGRNRFRFRRSAAVADTASAVAALRSMAAGPAGIDHTTKPPVFLFPGQGSQRVGMGRQLFAQQPVFRQVLEEADALLRPSLPGGLLAVLYPDAGASGSGDAAADNAAQAACLSRTEIAQPAIYAVSYAAALLWQSLGIEPSLLIGHSIGEFVAATLAGTLTFAEALHLVRARGVLMQGLPAGAMLAVRAQAGIVAPYLATTAGVELASINAPKSVVVSGQLASIEALAARLAGDGIACRRLATSHAFHSGMMDAVLGPFRKELAAVEFRKPRMPWISTLTGSFIDEQAVTTPEYWLEQLRSPVRFGDAVRAAIVAGKGTGSGTGGEQSPAMFLECGPGQTLSNLVRQNLSAPDEAVALATLPFGDAAEDGPGTPFEEAVALLWEQGFEPDWAALHAAANPSKPAGRKRVPLPTYPFERKSYWIAPPEIAPPEETAAADDAVTANPSLLPAGLHQLPETPVHDPLVHHLLVRDPYEANSMAASSPATLLVDDLKALVTELSDLDLSATASSTSFLELGLDSLFLTQLTQAIRGKYGVKLSFRQIMGDYSTFDALAAHLVAVAPKEKLPAAPLSPTAAPPATPAAVPAFMAAAPALSSSAVHGADGYAALFAQQMAAMSALMQQQLAVLQGAGTLQATPAPAPAGRPAAVPLPVKPASALPAALEKELGTLMPLRPLDLKAGEALTPKQQQYMSALIERYNRKTAKSKASAQHYRGVLADPRVASGFNPQFKEAVYPLAVERSAGAYLWDVDGNRYIDILNGYGSIFFGHSPQFVTDAVRHQLDLGFPIGPQTELAGECAELITKLVGMERATFCNTGSEAVMAAMRLARTVTGRSLIVLFAGAYHGQIDEVLVKSNRSEKSIPTAPGIPGESVANMLVLEYGSPHALEVIRRRADEIAAVLVEPIQSRHPELRPKEFLQEVRAITREAGAALIFDEVVTGFRTHLGGAQELFGIRADLATYGKVVAGGMPVGVVAGSRTYMDALDGGDWQFGDASVPQVGVTFFAGTFVRHPLTMAAVRATLEHLRDAGTKLQDDLAARNTALVGDLNAMFREFGFPSKIEHFASWFFFSVPAEARLAKLLYYHLRERGLHLQEGFPCFLTTAHTEADLAEVRSTFRHVLEEMHAHEIIGLPQPSAVAAVSMAAVSTAAVPPAAVPMTEVPMTEAPMTEAPMTEATITEATITEATITDAPITEAQREVLLASQLGAEASCAFNESVSLYLDGPLDRTALKQALQQVVERHQALRLSVAPGGDTILVHRAAVEAGFAIGLQEEDWRQATPDEQQRRLEDLLHAEAAAPFDLYTAPLFRSTLVRLAEEHAVLLFTGHHIIVDGWSINVIFEEAGRLYSSLRTGAPAALLPVHSFVEQAKTEHAEPDAETEVFWLEQFRTLPPPLELPVDRPRGVLRDHRGSTLRRTFSKELVARLRAASAGSGNTLFTTLLSGYFLLLGRLTQQPDLVVGIPMAGQRNFAGESFVGHSVNFLPIRALLNETTTFAELGSSIRNSIYDALDHQQYTLGTLVRKLNVPRNPARLELVEAQFNLEQVGSGLAFDGLRTRLEANAKAGVNADIFFNFVDKGAEIALECDYNTGLFDEATIERWIGCLATLLEEAVAHPYVPASQLRWLDAAAEERILVEWNRTASEYPSHLPVHTLFEQQVAKTPGSIAIKQAGRSLTYAELNQQANQFARLLEDEHPKQAAIRVALSLDRSPEMYAAILGVLKAGGVYIPIDPTYPPARLEVLLKDAEPTLLLTQQAMLENFDTAGLSVLPPILTMESIEGRLASFAGGNVDRSVSAEDPAYIMYTSGSTGNPKGVIVPHRAIARLVIGSDFIHFGPDEVFLQLAPVSFDASTLEIWGALLHGATLALIGGNKPTPEEIGEAILAYGVTTMWLTAALFHLMVMDHLDTLKPLRQLLAGGDVLSVSHVRKVLEALPALRLVNGYGPTEGTTFTCCHTITLASLEADSVPIGRPISNTRVYILDAQGAPVPAGVPGQLHAAGDGLALGYWKAPELTAQKFIELDLGPAGRERLYRTGDTARFLADGTVMFQGRTDNQVKVRGFRVELGEIEAAAERLPGVRAAVAAARPDWSGPEDIPGDKRLALYFLAEASLDGAVLQQQLRDHLRSQLPDHMQPAAIMQLDGFPRTANGKVDYRALPAPEAERRRQGRPVAEPTTAEETVLASIWCKVLQLDTVSIHDSIFELGGDSLSIFRITTQANQAGIRMTAKHLFQYKTIAAVSRQLAEDDSAAAQTAPARATIRPIARDKFRKSQSLTHVE